MPDVVEQLRRLPQAGRFDLSFRLPAELGVDDEQVYGHRHSSQARDPFLAAPVSYKGKLVQYAGRILRPHDGKTTAEVHDYVYERTRVLAASMVVLDASRRGQPVPRLAAWSLGTGICATVGANLAHGVGRGQVGALVNAWPALAPTFIRLVRTAPDAVDLGEGCAEVVGERVGGGDDVVAGDLRRELDPRRPD